MKAARFEQLFFNAFFSIDIMDLLTIFDYAGTLVFAISGALTAAEKRFDFFGAAAIAFVTAIGGGTIRDVLLGDFPVLWMQNLDYFWLILAGVAITILFKKRVLKLRKTLFLFDTIGIATFTLLGLKKALLFNIDPTMAVLMGLSSAVVGGVIRDIICNEVPLIFHKEIYATACIFGALVYLILHKFHVHEPICETATVLSIIAIRLIVVKYKLTIPKFKQQTD